MAISHQDGRETASGVGVGTLIPPGSAWDPANHQRLLQKVRTAVQPPPQTSFCSFLRHLWTVDESRAGQVRPWPWDGKWKDLWHDWEEALLTCSPLLVDKTRRVMASNVVCAFDLWLCLGGQDPRWVGYELLPDGARREFPVLMQSKAKRSILIQAQLLGSKEGDVRGSAEFVDRIKMLYEGFVEHGGKHHWSNLPTARWSFGAARFSNWSKINAVPQGGEQVRGPGTLLIHMEEVSHMDQARESVNNAIPALSGTGHIVAVTTPAAACYAKDIVTGRV